MKKYIAADERVAKVRAAESKATSCLDSNFLSQNALHSTMNLEAEKELSPTSFESEDKGYEESKILHDKIESKQDDRLNQSPVRSK